MNVFDITDIENEIKELVESFGISSRTYCNRPKAAEQLQDFIVVKCGTISDRVAYGECTVSVHLFAKDIGNLKNGKKLSLMYRQFVENLPPEYGDLLFDTAPKILGDAPDDYGFHARIINIQTTIKIQEQWQQN